MKYWAGSVFGALTVASMLSGCAELGNGGSSSLPKDAHYKPTESVDGVAIYRLKT